MDKEINTKSPGKLGTVISFISLMLLFGILVLQINVYRGVNGNYMKAGFTSCSMEFSNKIISMVPDNGEIDFRIDGKSYIITEIAEEIEVVEAKSEVIETE